MTHTVLLVEDEDDLRERAKFRSSQRKLHVEG